jgi:hypothetical protein
MKWKTDQILRTCYPTTIHPAWSIAAGILFGAGNGAVFIYSGNYLAHSYGIYAASAMVSNPQSLVTLSRFANSFLFIEKCLDRT